MKICIGKRNFNLTDCFALLVGLMLFAATLWRARYGYSCTDDSFYLNIPYRLIQGDMLLVDEWNLSQLAALLSVAPMWLFVKLSSSTQGVVLFFRVLFVLIAICTYAFIYLRLRKISPLPALIAAAIFTAFSHTRVATPWYNSYANILLADAFIIMATTDGGIRDALTSGACFAAAVLCCPYLMGIYAIYCAAACIYIYIYIYGRREQPALTLRFWLCFTAAAAALALLLILPIIARYGVSKLLAVIPNLFNGGEHSQISAASVLKIFLLSVLYNRFAEIVLAGCLLLALLIIVSKNRFKAGCALFAAALTALYFSHYLLFPGDRHLNLLVFPFCIMGFFSYFLCEKKNPRLLYYLFVPGVLYSLCACFASNAREKNAGGALIVAAIFASFYSAQLALELWNGAPGKQFRRIAERIISLALACVLLLQFSTYLYYRLWKPFRDESPNMLTAEIATGPLKGLRTTEKNRQRYNLIVADTQTVRDFEQPYVVYYTNETWLYLMDNARCGSFSAWMDFMAPETVPGQLKNYWTAFPEKKPRQFYSFDIKNIYGDNERSRAVTDFFLDEGYTLSILPSGYLFTLSAAQ